MTVAERANLAEDPYGFCIARFILRTLDRDNRTIAFKFDDGSQAVFKISYQLTATEQDE